MNEERRAKNEDLKINSSSKIYFNSPIGLIEIVGRENSITKVNFVEEISTGEISPNPYLNGCAIQLNEYFAGTRKIFELNLEPDGTEFQKRVWRELMNIQFGTAHSYLDQSKALGDIKAIRAVASANGQNPIAIIIPCHRVIGSDGSLTGYAGGLWRKKWLLEHEQSFYDGEKQLQLF